MIRSFLIAGLFLPFLASCALWQGGEGDEGKQPARRVVVEPVDGTTLPLGRLLARAVAEELGILGIRAEAATQPGGAPGDAYVIRGRAEPNSDGPNSDGKALLALIHWTLTDPQGRAVGTHTEPVRGARTQWEYGDPRLLQAIGEATAEALEPLISSP